MRREMEMQTVLTNVATRLTLLTAILATALSGCANQNSVPFPTVTTSYVLLQNVAIPGVPPKTGSWGNAFGNVDTADGVYLLSDRTLAGIDVISLSTMQYLRTAGAGSFVGNRSTPASSAGPNDVVAIGNGQAMGTDGNSDVIIVDVNSGATVAKVTIPNTGNTKNRADLLGFDPKDNVALVGNDASVPSPVLTFISTVAPYPVLGQIFMTNATGGIENPTYDPAQGMFLTAVPGTTANPGGEIDVINPTTRAIVKVYPTVANCGPTGTALGPGEQLAVSCSNLPTGSQIIDATNGNSLASLPVVNGCDQVVYNSGDNRFFYACSHALSGTVNTPFVAAVDAGSHQVITTIPTGASSNSVSVDPGTNRVYIPLRKTGLNVYYYQ